MPTGRFQKMGQQWVVLDFIAGTGMEPILYYVGSKINRRMGKSEK